MDTKNDLKKETAVIVQAQGVDTSIPVMKEPSSMAKPSITGSFQGQVKLEESKTQETPAAGIDEDKQAVLGAPASMPCRAISLSIPRLTFYIFNLFRSLESLSFRQGTIQEGLFRRDQRYSVVGTRCLCRLCASSIH